MSVDVAAVAVSELTIDQAWSMFERRCHEELQVTADEFIAALDAGQIPDSWSADAVSRLEMLLPFVR